MTGEKYSKSFKGSLSEAKEGNSGPEVTFKEKGGNRETSYINFRTFGIITFDD